MTGDVPGAALRAQRRVPDLAAARATSRAARGSARSSRWSGASCARAKRTPAARADLTIAVSDDDRERLAELGAGHPRMRRFRPASTPSTSRRAARAEVPARLVFSGSMDWHPNEDAVCYFVDTILPRIRAEVPGRVVHDRRPQSRARACASLPRSPACIVTGTIDDVRPSIDEASVYVVPLRAGSGTRIKIFEALAMGKAVVSTTVGAEGLALESGPPFPGGRHATRFRARRRPAAPRPGQAAGARRRGPRTGRSELFLGDGRAPVRRTL